MKATLSKGLLISGPLLMAINGGHYIQLLAAPGTARNPSGERSPFYCDTKLTRYCFGLAKTRFEPRLTPATLLLSVGAESISRSSGVWDVLTNEMRRYEYAIGPTGQISYRAPSGYHDDCVMALALANHGRWEAGNCGRILALPGVTRQRRVGMARRARHLAG